MFYTDSFNASLAFQAASMQGKKRKKISDASPRQSD